MARRAPLLALALLALPAADAAAQGDRGTFYSEIQPGVGAKVELAAGVDFALPVVYELYFFSDSSRLTTIIPGIGQDIRVFHTAPGDETVPVLMEKCRVVDRAVRCEELDEPPVLDVAPDFTFVELEIPPQKIDWEGEFLRLTIPEGRFRLSVCAERPCEADHLTDPRPTPAIDARPLPTLTDRERQFVEQRPFLKFDVSPLVRDQRTGTGGFDEAAVEFDGGMYRTTRDGRWLLQLKWGGHVATKKDLSFDRLSLEAGVARNLIRADWLPLTLSARGESDRDFDAIDVSATADIAYVLPFSVNLQTGAYRPNSAPRLKAIAAYGHAVDRSDPAQEDGFVRAGYELNWRLPVAETAVLRLHHAGLWNEPADASGEWHALWDVAAEVEIGGVTYFIGYQEGEAAPLFQPTETTRVGLSFAIRRPDAR